MPDVFLSYKREDLKAATRLVKALRAEGLEVWWDRDIPASAPWEATIEKALAEARAVLVLWSRAAVASDNVRSEARWAREQGRLIQLFIEPCNPPLFFGERQGIDLAGWSGGAEDGQFRELVAVLHERLGRAPERRAPRERPTRRLGRPLVWAGAAVLAVVLVVGAWAVSRGLLGVGAAQAQNIAILPFKTLTTGADVHAFADGLADELQSVLSNNGTPTVSSETARTLRGPGKDGRVRALGVRLIVDGAAQSDGKTINVSVHVDDPSHHVTLWTAELEGPADNPTALQAQVGARIISVLNCSASALRPKGGLSDPETLGLQLKACDLLETQSLGDDAQAVFGMLDAFRQVTQRAPGFGPGHSALAIYLGYYRQFLPSDLMPQLGDEADREAHKALAIDPKDPKAFIALGMLVPPGQFLKEDQLFSRSLALDPNGIYPNMFAGGSSMTFGRLQYSLAHIQRAVAANPMSLEQTSDTVLAWNGQTHAAEEELARLRRLWPDNAELWADRVEVYAIARNWPELRATLQDANRPKSLSDGEFSRLQLAVEAAVTGSPKALAAARRALLDQPSDDPADLSDRIKYLAWLGFPDDAFAVADRFARLAPLPSGDLPFLFSPLTASLRKDPRFMTLAARLGLVAYWSKSGDWPDFCSEPGLPYDCKAEAAKLAAAPRVKT